MTQLTGMMVTVITSSETTPGDPQTSDQIYIGVFGTGGGREFPLRSPGDNFQTGKTQNFKLGDIWQTYPTGFPYSVPFGAPGDDTHPVPVDPKKPLNNDPTLVLLDLDRVNYVYLRKTGAPSRGTTYEGGDEDEYGADDAYRLQEATVKLYGPPIPTNPSMQKMRTFVFKTNSDNELKSVWIGTEFGLVIYLIEERVGATAT